MAAELEYVEDGDWDRVRLNVVKTAKLLSPPVPQARVYNNAAISITNNTATALTFNTERWDNGALHSTTTNTSRLTSPITGLYEIGAHVSYAANAAGRRETYLRVNGATVIALDERQAVTTASVSTVVSLSTAYQLAATDYVEVVVFQDSGGALNIAASAASSPEFWMFRVAGYTNQGV